MIAVIDVNKKIEFVSKHDESEPKNIFIIRPLSGIEMMDYSDLNNKDNMFKFLDTSIVEVKNINVSKQDFIRSLTLPILTELIVFTTEINNLTESDKKKF